MGATRPVRRLGVVLVPTLGSAIVKADGPGRWLLTPTLARGSRPFPATWDMVGAGVAYDGLCRSLLVGVLEEGNRRGNRNSEVVQRRQGVWVHHPRWGRCRRLRSLQRYYRVGLQEPRREPEGGVRSHPGSEGAAGQRRPRNRVVTSGRRPWMARAVAPLRPPTSPPSVSRRTHAIAGRSTRVPTSFCRAVTRVAPDDWARGRAFHLFGGLLA